MYCKVENNQVVGVFYTLPRSFGNVSGFDRLSQVELCAYGFYPLQEVRPTLTSISHDDGELDEQGTPILRQVFTEQYGAHTDQIEVDKVVRTYQVIPIPATEIREAKNRPTAKRIRALEETALLPRAVREFLLDQPGASQKPWYAKAKPLDDEVAALRRKLV